MCLILLLGAISVSPLGCSSRKAEEMFTTVSNSIGGNVATKSGKSMPASPPGTGEGFADSAGQAKAPAPNTAPMPSMMNRMMQMRAARGGEAGGRPETDLGAADDGLDTQTVTSLGGRTQAAGSTTTQKVDRGPQVWHRDAQRPTFARVYVGAGNSLELVSLQVTVTIEGPRARTVVDHIFHNPHNRQLEGTFEYPLPTGASPSYFAMFIGQTRETVPTRFGRWGNTPPLPRNSLAGLTPAELVKKVNTADWGRLQEARVVSQARALEVYEETIRRRIDPALLEYASGNTFRGRVFPIPARGYNRVIVAYEELLPTADERCVYRFPLPTCRLQEVQVLVQARADDCGEPVFLPKDSLRQEGGGRLMFSHAWKNQGPGGEVRFAFRPPEPGLQAISGRQGENGPVYLYARIRPDLPSYQAQPFAHQAVFLLDTSLSEHPDRFAVNMKLLRKILENDPDIRQFNVLAFNVGAAWLEPGGWLKNTPEGRERAVSRLDGLVLEGATNLSAALDRLVHPGFAVAGPVNAFLLSDGQITWGESDVATLVAGFETRCPFPIHFHCYSTGIGAENSELFDALARRGGGVFHCYGEAGLASAATAHRSQCLQLERVGVTGASEVGDVLVAGRRASVYPGGELVVAARLKTPGRTHIVVEGTFLGQKWTRQYPVEVTGFGELAPRGWGEIAVASLLALNNPQFDDLVTAYCQQFNIGSRVASFLVLENDADYKRLNLQQERGKAITGDLGVFLQETWRRLGQTISNRDAWLGWLAKVTPRLQFTIRGGRIPMQQLLELLTDKDFAMPDGQVPGRMLTQADVPPTYLAARHAKRRQVPIYLDEARRRMATGDMPGAVSALSSVIEEYPGRTDALRLVGYRLVFFQQFAAAVGLFRQVQGSRPFEPHSYRDLAHSLAASGRFGLAALQYEIVLAGAWDARFHQSIKTVALEEYAQMMQQAIRSKRLGKGLVSFFEQRLKQIAAEWTPCDLRVTISWNTDNTDVDLWVIEPNGHKVFYQQPNSPSGGRLSEDQTQGYGPERYQIANAQPGVYTIIVHYFNSDPNLLGGETHVHVAVVRHAGTPGATVERHTVILKHKDEQAEVCRVKF